MKGLVLKETRNVVQLRRRREALKFGIKKDGKGQLSKAKDEAFPTFLLCVTFRAVVLSDEGLTPETSGSLSLNCGNLSNQANLGILINWVHDNPYRWKSLYNVLMISSCFAVAEMPLIASSTLRTDSAVRVYGFSLTKCIDFYLQVSIQYSLEKKPDLNSKDQNYNEKRQDYFRPEIRWERY